MSQNNTQRNMNNWHSTRFLLIGAVAAIVAGSCACSFIQTSYAYGDRQTNDKQDCKSVQGKGPFGGRGDFDQTSTYTGRGLSDFGWLARPGHNSGQDGSDGQARSGTDGANGRAGIARTICVIVDPDITIPSDVPISYVMSRPNWDNAIINPMEHLK